MPTQKWRWLVGYHFFREQYLARNSKYLMFIHRLHELQDEYQATNPKSSLPYDHYVWAECFQKEKYLKSKEMTKFQIRLIKQGISITNKLKKMDGSFSTGFGVETNFLLDHIANGHSPHETSPSLANSYTPRPGTFRVSGDALRKIEFDEKGFATVRFELKNSLPIQFIKAYKILAEQRNIRNESNEQEDINFERLEEIDYEIEYYVINSINRIAYSPRSDLPRSIGLWLFDYCEENNCGGPSSINELRKTDFINRLRLDSKQDREFQRWLSATKKCIEAADVYALS